jgi:hypothetical protein
MSVHSIYNVFAYGRPLMIFLTLIYTFVLDQMKSIATLSLTYMVVVRRFMYLEINDESDFFGSKNGIPK